MQLWRFLGVRLSRRHRIHVFCACTPARRPLPKVCFLVAGGLRTLRLLGSSACISPPSRLASCPLGWCATTASCALDPRDGRPMRPSVPNPTAHLSIRRTPWCDVMSDDPTRTYPRVCLGWFMVHGRMSMEAPTMNSPSRGWDATATTSMAKTRSNQHRIGSEREWTKRMGVDTCTWVRSVQQASHGEKGCGRVKTDGYVYL
mmetsp:Transcript_9779/g.59493  ORF Transcript_9779/g.59493 Transcript_9779/m.59493 type:complete len:202 (-) Transcript_9779:743-1348(-)